MHTDIQDATIAAVAVIMEQLDTPPADRKQLEEFFGCIISAAIESVVREMNIRHTPSQN